MTTSQATQYQQLCEVTGWCVKDVYGATGVREDVQLTFDAETLLWHARIRFGGVILHSSDEDALMAIEGLHILVGRTAVECAAENIELDRLWLEERRAQ